MSNYTKCIIFSFTLYQWNLFCTKVFFSVLFLFLLLREKGCVPFQYVSVFLLMVIVFISNRAGEHEMCWYLSTVEERVFRYTAVGFTEALKPFVGLF